MAAQPLRPQYPGAEPPLDLSVLNCAPLSPYRLHEHDPDVQDLYSRWLDTRPAPPPYDPALPARGSVLAISRDPWTTKAAAAWVLSQQLSDHVFERYALAQLIQNCGLALFGPWAFIEARGPDRSSIRRFTNHWVAWNAALAGGSRSEFTGLYAATLVNRVVRQETHDPRTFELEHWFSACGDDLAAKCSHDPVVRRAAERERLRPVPPKVPQVGRVAELRQQGQKTPWRSCWKFKRRIVFSILFLLDLFITVLVVGLQLGMDLPVLPGVRLSNVRFTSVVVIVGVGQSIFVFFRWRWWFAVYCFIFNICALANGVTWAIDAKSCIQFRGSVRCEQISYAVIGLGSSSLGVSYALPQREPSVAESSATSASWSPGRAFWDIPAKALTLVSFGKANNGLSDVGGGTARTAGEVPVVGC